MTAMNGPILILSGFLLTGLLLAEKKESLKGKLAAKPLLSFMFILTAVVQPHPLPGYYHLMLAGLILCMGGDVFLALTGQKMFRLGLVSFLLGHLMYAGAFFRISETGILFWGGCAGAAGIGVTVYRWLAPNLGSMKVPVVCYIIVISIMLCAAAAVADQSSLNSSGRWLVLTGALLFYVSDLFVARQRFVKKGFVNRLFGLPLYYSGQFMLAFSVGMIG